MTIDSLGVSSSRIKNPDIRHFRTPEAFLSYLANTQAPSWCTKICIHHTVVPTIAQWRGLSSMQAMLAYYRRLGWVTFPHLYVAPDGIWQMNNIRLKGTHANAANAFSVGVEVVGNYDQRVWEEPIYTYAVDTIKYLLQWRGLTDKDIIAHREYNSAKTCPGRSITNQWVRAQLGAAPPEAVRYRVKQDYSRVRQGPSTSYPVAGRLMKGDTFISSALKADESGMFIGGVNMWAHTTKTIQTSQGNIDHLGFIHTSLLERI